MPVKENARARAALAVDVAQAPALEILHALNAFGVARRDDQALLTDGQIEQDDSAFGIIFVQKGEIEVAGVFFQQMHARHMADILFQGRDAAHAAHVRGNQAEGVRQAHEFIGQEVQHVVVAAHADQIVIEPGGRHGKPRRTKLPSAAPSASAGMRMTAWARVTVLMLPAPRLSGMPTAFSPTRPTARCTNSSRPRREGRLRVSSTSISGRAGMDRWASRQMAGVIKFLKADQLLTG